MERISIWRKNAELPSFNPLGGDTRTDVLIIGGGMAGILCARELRDRGIDCMLVEAKNICSGITENTTAKITLQHGLIYDKMIRRFGTEGARMYVCAQSDAMSRYQKLCEGIECDYEEKDSFVYSLSDRSKIEKEVVSMQRLGLKADFTDDLSLPFDVAGAVRLPRQAQFDPLKFILNISSGLPIFENTKVLELGRGWAKTDRGTVKAKAIIVATHFPFINKHGSFFLKLYQHRSYVSALEKAPDVHGMYVDEDEKGMSFRNYKDLLLLVGGGHRTGKNGGNWQELEAFAKKHYPGARIHAKWATQDCMTLDGIPYIGKYSSRTPHLFVATGFNKWGMTSSMVAAPLLADLVEGKKNEYAEIFSPSRSILRPQLAVNAAESILGLITPTVPRCPHLGCALRYNKAEHSWDCPCHGSRFSETGRLINNPATDDKRK